MIRGTTPTHRFRLPVEESIVKEVRIIYEQSGEDVLLKTLKDCRLENGYAVLKLTQEETLRFDSSQIVKVQMRMLTSGGDALASNIKRVAVGKLLEDEVME